MITVKYVLGVVLLVVAFYFAGSKIALLSRLVPYASVGWLVAFGALGLGLIVALVVRRTTAERLKQALLVFAVTASTLGGYGIVTKLTRAEVTLTWQHQHFAQHQQRALSAQRPMLVDFTANWCAACKELERETFAHPDVSNEAGRFLAVKVDASVDDDPEVVATMKTLAVKGLPTVILFDSQGHEAERFTDFVKADVMLGALR
jgi:thiol:disulfide interchange protein DsbD